MTEQFLDFSQICPHIEKVGRIAVAQAMGMHSIAQTARPATTLQASPHISRREAPDVGVIVSPKDDEERFGENPGATTSIEPERQGEPRLFGNRNDSLLVALAHDPHLAAMQIDIPHIQRREFSHANARPVEQLHDGAVAQPGQALPRLFRAFTPGRGVDIGQRKAIVHREGPGGVFGQFRRRNARGGIQRDLLLPLKEAEERANTRESAPQGGSAALAVKRGKPIPHSVGIDAVGSGLRPQGIGEQTDIGQIGTAGMGRERALDPQVAIEIPYRVFPVHTISAATADR